MSFSLLDLEKNSTCECMQILQLRDVAMATISLAFYIWGAHWRHLANTTELYVCGGDAALCQLL